MSRVKIKFGLETNIEGKTFDEVIREAERVVEAVKTIYPEAEFYECEQIEEHNAREISSQ